jgi:Hint domain
MVARHWQKSGSNLSGSWTDASHWTGNGAPTTSGDSADIALAGTYTVTLNAGETIGALTLNNAGATLALGANSLVITNSGGQAGTAALTAGHVTIAGGSISTTGGISVASAADIIGAGTIGGTGSLSGAGVVKVSGGTLTISANISDATGLGFATTGTATLALGGALIGSDNIAFGDASDTLSLTTATSLSSFSSASNTITLSGFVAGDVIHIGSGATVTKVVLSHPTGSTTDVNVSLSGGGTAVFHLSSAETGLFANWTTTDISLNANPCYLAGTRILTARGEVAVEELNVGDLLVTQAGEALPIRWIGTRDHVVRLIPADERQKLLPIRFARGSLGNGLPRRDLFISPEHCVSMDGVLIPAYELVNGSTIDYFDDLEVIRYFHLELPRHSVVYAEGAAAESYLDTGNRNMFANALDSPLCAEPVSTEPCQPIVVSGSILGEIRSRLAVQADLLEAASTVWSPLAAWRAQPQHMNRATQSF